MTTPWRRRPSNHLSNKSLWQPHRIPPLKKEPEDGEDGENGSGEEEGEDGVVDVDDEEDDKEDDNDDVVVAGAVEEDCVSVPCVPVSEPTTVIVGAPDTPSGCGTASASALTVTESRPPDEPLPATVPDVPSGPGPPLSITLDGQAPVSGFVLLTPWMPTVLDLGISRGPGPPLWMLDNLWPVSERATLDAPVHGAPPWIALEHC